MVQTSRNATRRSALLEKSHSNMVPSEIPCSDVYRVRRAGIMKSLANGLFDRGEPSAEVAVNRDEKRVERRYFPPSVGTVGDAT
jgi:hypothetical protein